MSFSTDGVKFTHRPRKANLFFGFFVKITEAVLSVLFIITLAAPFGFPNQADAALGVSTVLSYQGRLTGNTGSPLGGGSPGTTYCMRFSLYTAASAGSALWPVSGTATTTTPIVIDGVFNVDIPDANTFDFSTNNTPYLNVEVYNVSGASCTGGSWENLTPRQRVDAVAYARVAENVYSTLLKTDNANNRVQIGETGTNPTLLLLGVKNTTDYIGDTCSINGTVWFNSGSSRGLICESLHLKALSNATSTLDAVVPAGNLSVAATTISSGSVTLAGGANITLSQAGNAITIIGGAGGGGAAFSAGTQSVNTGTVNFANSNNISFGMSGSNQITASAAFGGVAGSAASTVTGGIVQFGNLNNISFGLNASTMTASYSQSVQTQNLHNLTISSNTAGVGAAISSGTLALAGGANITLSQNGGNTITIIGGAGGAAGSNMFGVSNLGNTSGTSGTVYGSAVQMLFAGGNNITLSQSINGASGTVTVSGVSFSNANNFTFGLNAGTLTASYSQSVQTQNLHNLTISSNTAGVGAAISSGTLALAGGANITLSQNGGNTITIIGAAGGGGAAVSRLMWPINNIGLVAITGPAQGTMSIQYFPIGQQLTASRMDVAMSFALGSSAAANTAGVAISQTVGIYSKNANTLMSMSTSSNQQSISWASNTGSYLSIAGLRLLSSPININATPGDYYIIYNVSTAQSSMGTATTALAPGMSLFGQTMSTLGIPYATNWGTTATSQNMYGGMGVYSAQVATAPGNLSLSAILQTGANASKANFWVQLRNL